MWILSQNREELFECKRAISIRPINNKDYEIIGDLNSKLEVVLGTYSKYENVKEVLIKIADQLRNITSWGSYEGCPDDNFPSSLSNSEAVFEMPKDNE